MEIIVVRGPGDKEADPIIDALLTTEEVALSRGRAFLDAHSSYEDMRRLSVDYQDGFRLGGLVEVVDNIEELRWRGKIVGISHKGSIGEASVGLYTELTLERRVAA